MSSGHDGGNDQGQGTRPSSGALQPPDSGDQVDELVDWQMSNTPVEARWSCPECGMNWTEPPDPCPCGDPGRPNPATMELCFWEAITRCVLDEQVPLTVSLCDGTETSQDITLPNPIPPQLWRYMAEVHAELIHAAGVVPGSGVSS